MIAKLQSIDPKGLNVEEGSREGRMDLPVRGKGNVFYGWTRVCRDRNGRGSSGEDDGR